MTSDEQPLARIKVDDYGDLLAKLRNTRQTVGTLCWIEIAL
jgi:hypothetical protein